MDILEITGDAYKGRDMLVYQTEMSDNAIKCMTEDANLEIPSDECKLINNIVSQVNKHMGNSVYPQLRHARMNFDKCIESPGGPAKEKKEMMEITGRMSILNLDKAIQESNDEIILPDINGDHVYANHNPLYAGTLMLDVDTMTNELTCAVATHNYAIFDMAHLYYASANYASRNYAGLPWRELMSYIPSFIRQQYSDNN